MNGRLSFSDLGQAVILATALLSSLATVAVDASPRLASVSTDVAKILPISTQVSAVPSSQIISVDIVLPSRDQAGLDAFVKAVSDPKSPRYGQYLSAAKFAAQFGAKPADMSTISKWATGEGLTVTQRTTSGFLTAVSGTAAQIETAFAVTLNNYKSPSGETFFSAPADAQLPVAIAPLIKTIVGLSNYPQLKPLYRVVTPEQRQQAAAMRSMTLGGFAPTDFGSGTGHAGGMKASDLNKVYDMPGTGFQGRGQILAVYEEGGYFIEDVYRYQAYNKIAGPWITNRLVDGYSGAVDDLSIATEAALDVDMELALAPNAKQIRVYEAAPPFAPSLLNALQAVADDDVASVLSISYGLDEDIMGSDSISAENMAFEQLAAEGTSVFVAAGDNGAYGDGGAFSYPALLNVSDPASQPLVTSVGGTELYASPYDESYLGEVTWNELGLGDGATGGGVSAVWPIPGYQLDNTGSSVAVPNGGSATNRNVPDVAAVADPFTGVDIYATAYGGWIPIGGTSAATPIWAGLAGDVNETRQAAGLPVLGFANPEIYTLGQNPYAAIDFHDILDGTNGNQNLFGTPGYFAGYGYDNVSGWGSFDGTQILPDLASAPAANVNPPDAPTDFKGTPQGTSSIKLTWARDKSAKGFYVFDVTSAGNLIIIGTTTSDSFTVNNLQPGFYEFYLTAVNLGGETPVAYPIYVLAP